MRITGEYNTMVFLLGCELRRAGAIGVFSGSWVELMAESESRAVEALVGWAHVSGFEPRGIQVASARMVASHESEDIACALDTFAAFVRGQS